MYLRKNSLIILLCVVVIAVITYFLAVEQFRSPAPITEPSAPVNVTLEIVSLKESLAVNTEAALFSAALLGSGLMAANSEGSEKTVFLPIDSAFSVMSQADRDFLLSPTNQGLLNRHLIAGEVTFPEPGGAPMVYTALDATEIRLTNDAGILKINGIEVTLPKIESTDGSAYLIGGLITSNIRL